MKVIDNFLSLKEENKIINLLKNPFFPWYYLENITYDKSNKDYQIKPAFCHLFKKDGLINSDYFKDIKFIVDKFTNNEILQCRSFYQLPLNQKYIKDDIDSIHVDMEIDHTVYLYYVFDSDGDTILYKNNKIFKKITPKQGRLLIFNGDLLHTARQPELNERCVINFDIKGKNVFPK
jgi:hypothetical protein